MYKMYDDLAAWWPLLSPPNDYLDEAEFFRRVLESEGLPVGPTLLELGSGGGLRARRAPLRMNSLSPAREIAALSAQEVDVDQSNPRTAAMRSYIAIAWHTRRAALPGQASC